jgi:general secretion pathway protein K
VCRPAERGVALLAATVALAALSLTAVGLARSSLLDQRLTQNALAALQADALLRSGVAAAAVALAEVGDAPDTLRAPWTQRSGRQPLGAGWVEVRLEDEARRLDLNLMPPDVLRALCRQVGVDPTLVDALADWIDADDTTRPHGAERPFYRGLGLVGPANAPLRTVGELALVHGFDAETVARLRPFVTVAGEPSVNPNTAPREVLLALDPALAPLVALRDSRYVDPGEIETLVPGLAPTTAGRLTARGSTYTAHVIAGVGDLRQAVDALLRAPGGAEPEVVAWRPVTPP